MTDKVLDFKLKREEIIEKKRRNFERIVFENFLGAYTVINQNGSIYPVTLVDISREGCLFQVPWNVKKDKKFDKTEEITMRLYFSNKSYIPVVINIKYGKEHLEDGETYMRYGCEFDQSYPSFQALEHFVNFLYSFAEHSAVDKGDEKVYFL